MGFTGADRRRRFLFSPSRVLAKSAVFLDFAWRSVVEQCCPGRESRHFLRTPGQCFPTGRRFVPGVQDDDDSRARPARWRLGRVAVVVMTGRRSPSPTGGCGDDRLMVPGPEWQFGNDRSAVTESRMALVAVTGR